jgi:hypothetical protein
MIKKRTQHIPLNGGENGANNGARSNIRAVNDDKSPTY